MNCAACNAFVDAGAQLLRCNACKQCFHSECLNIKPHQYEALSEDFRAAWKCPSCNNVTRRTRSNLLTPVRSTQIPTYEETVNMSCDNIERDHYSTHVSIPTMDGDSAGSGTSGLLQSFTSELHTTLKSWKSDLNSTLATFKEDIKGTLHGWRDDIDSSLNKLNTDLNCALDEIRKDMVQLCNENRSIKQDFTKLSQTVVELQTSLQFHSDEQVALIKRMDSLDKRIDGHSTQSTCLLESKIDALEQQARQCNLEIQGLPDTRGENLVNILEMIGNTINFPVTQKDVISIHRVPHAHQQTKTSKNVVVKLQSRILRDNLLAAARRFKTLRSNQLGFTGASTNIYMNEHLTLKRKLLFRKTKEVASKCNYKYVWVRNATILVRERDGCAAFAIHTEEDLRRISGTSPSNVSKRDTVQ